MHELKEMTGYWEPHSSSVDFCETNYFLTDLVAEPHNVWSSLFISLIGLIGLFYGNPTREHCVAVMYLVLAGIGFGSAALHATLHWIPQSSDEVPMLWQILSFLHMMYVIEMGDKKQSYSNIAGMLYFVITAVQTVMYYKYQKTYAIFIVSFIIYSVVVIIGSYRMVNNAKSASDKAIRWILWKWAFLSYAVFGAGLWIVDMNACDFLTPYYNTYFFGCTLHVLWHIFAGMGSYLIATCMVATRLQQLGKIAKLKWLLFLPICVEEKSHKNN